MQGHFRYLLFKTFPMTPRTPQCEVFWALLLNSKHSGVPEDSKSPTLGMLGFTPTLGQSGVATPNLYRVQDHGRDLLGRFMASHTMPWLGSMCFLMHTIMVLHQNLLLFFALLTSQHKKLVWHLEFLPLGRLMDSHLVQVLLPGLKELEQSCHNLFVLLTWKKNAPCWQRGRRLLHNKLLGHQILMSQEYMYIKKTHNFPLINLWSANFKCMKWFKSL